MLDLMLENIQINPNILEDAKYDYLFSVEVVNQQVLDGVPFREAYKNIGLAIESGTYQPAKEVNHSHQGSIGNLMNEAIAKEFEKNYSAFDFATVNSRLLKLLE